MCWTLLKGKTCRVCVLIWQYFRVNVVQSFTICNWRPANEKRRYPDSNAHWANMGTTWVLSASGGPHVGPMNTAITGASMNWASSIGSGNGLALCWFSGRQRINLIAFSFVNRNLFIFTQNWVKQDLPSILCIVQLWIRLFLATFAYFSLLTYYVSYVWL